MERVMGMVLTRIGRLVYSEPRLDTKPKEHQRSYTGEWQPKETTLEDPEANLISSLIDTPHKLFQRGQKEPLHAPAIDLDVPSHLVASSTPGHFHLYIDKPMPWSKYRKLLEVLRECDLIEEGFLRSSLDRRQSYLRLPHIKKKKS
jgi:hypothetical protein